MSDRLVARVALSKHPVLEHYFVRDVLQAFAARVNAEKERAGDRRVWARLSTIADDCDRSLSRVEDARDRLVDARLLRDTSERSGVTGQVKVYEVTPDGFDGYPGLEGHHRARVWRGVQRVKAVETLGPSMEKPVETLGPSQEKPVEVLTEKPVEVLAPAPAAEEPEGEPEPTPAESAAEGHVTEKAAKSPADLRIEAATAELFSELLADYCVDASAVERRDLRTRLRARLADNGRSEEAVAIRVEAIRHGWRVFKADHDGFFREKAPHLLTPWGFLAKRDRVNKASAGVGNLAKTEKVRALVSTTIEWWQGERKARGLDLDMTADVEGRRNLENLFMSRIEDPRFEEEFKPWALRRLSAALEPGSVARHANRDTLAHCARSAEVLSEAGSVRRAPYQKAMSTEGIGLNMPAWSGKQPATVTEPQAGEAPGVRIEKAQDWSWE